MFPKASESIALGWLDELAGNSVISAVNPVVFCETCVTISNINLPIRSSFAIDPMPKANSMPGGSSVLRVLVALAAATMLGTVLAITVWSPAVDRAEATKNILPAPVDDLVENAVDADTHVAVDSSGMVTIDGELDAVDWNLYLNQVVQVPGELVVVDTFDLARYGQLRIARERLYVPTSLVDPNDADASKVSTEGGSNVAKVTAAQKRNDRGSVTLDDGLDEENVFPFKLLPEVGSEQKTVRVGSSITDLTAQVVDQNGKLVLVPVGPMRIDFAERPDRPSVGDANVTVASFNVLNYFTTIDDGENNSRGASSLAELERQRSKIVSAIMGLDADVIGLMELENNLEAENDLVAALNSVANSETYTAVGLPKKFSDAPGAADVIRVGIIYRVDRLSPVGSVELIDDFAFVNARTPLVQRFRRVSGSDQFSVIVNHFKSKGGNANGNDKDKGDGQGAFNQSRKRQAAALANYIASRESKEPEANVVILGDLNSYQEEDPIDTLRAAGLVDLSEQFDTSSSSPYSYVYYGQSGSLDHAFATPGLAKQVTGVATWHINADEPRWLDYNLEFSQEKLFDPSPFRSSDHDPVIIGFRLD